MKNIIEKYSEVLKALGGKDDKVLSTCPECSFETRENKYGMMVSHGPFCSQRDSRKTQ